MIALNHDYERSTKRAQNKTVRVLRLIDLLAPRRMPLSIKEIHRFVVDETGQRWCERTIRRDLEVLEALNMVEQLPAGWRLNLGRSEQLQGVAFAVPDR